MEFVPASNLAQVLQRHGTFSLEQTERLLGKPPSSGKTPEQILAKQTTYHVPSLHAERRYVPRDLEDILRRAIRSDPNERFHSAGAFHAAVKSVFGGFLRRLVALFRPES